MIPRIIHYTWFSNDPYPELVEECIASWHKIMPEYEFRLWDMSSIKDIDSVFLREALQEQKWAFAADFVRLYAIYHYGGIYLDTDVMVFKSFDSLLGQQAFIGRENSVQVMGSTVVYLTSHCFGAEKGHPYIGKCLYYYSSRHFISSNDKTLPMSLKYDTKILPFIQCELASQIGYNNSSLMDKMQYCENGLVIWPSQYFDCLFRKDESFCHHYALGSWREKKRTKRKVTILYKIKWRIEHYVRLLLDRFGYLMIKKR